MASPSVMSIDDHLKKRIKVSGLNNTTLVANIQLSVVTILKLVRMKPCPGLATEGSRAELDSGALIELSHVTSISTTYVRYVYTFIYVYMYHFLFDYILIYILIHIIRYTQMMETSCYWSLGGTKAQCPYLSLLCYHSLHKYLLLVTFNNCAKLSLFDLAMMLKM